jgi:hypothetical protein
VLDVWIVLFGLAVHMAGKNWFLDRMALLYDDADSPAANKPPVARRTPRCRSADPCSCPT